MDLRTGSIRRKPVPLVNGAAPKTNMNILGEKIAMASPAPRMDVPASEESKPAKRPSRRLTKRFSLPTPASKKEGKHGSMTSTFSLPIFPRSSSAPTTTTISSPPSPALAPTSASKNPLPVPQSLSPPYDPLQNYIPCLFPTCTAHYLLATLGPTFYLPQAPYQLERKKGLCMTHAGKELRQANERCKKQFEGMRQNAGRKTLGTVDAEFENWLTQFRGFREEEIGEFEDALRRRVLGVRKPAKDSKKSEKKDESEAEWDWRYTPRRCTNSGCTADRYSPYDQRFYLWYHTLRITGLSILQTLCPVCARKDVDGAERERNQAWQDMHPQEWRAWMEQLKRNRVKEQEFWEKAQESRVRERGPAFRGDEGKGKEEKGGNLLEDLCVVM